MRSICLLAAVLLPFVDAKPLLNKRWTDYEVKHAWNSVPKGWKCQGPAPATHLLDMRIALKQDRFDDLVTALNEVSDPMHEKYVSMLPVMLDTG